MPTNLHDGLSYIVWGVLIFAAGSSAFTALFDRQFKKALLGFFIMAVLAVLGLYWRQIFGALPGWKFFVDTAALIYVVLLTYGYFSLRSDFNSYVMPREVTLKQSNIIQGNLAKYDRFAIAILFNNADQEARNYANQIASVIRQASWHVEVVTSQAPHVLQNVGLQTQEEGANWKSREPKSDPAAFLRDAFAAAKVPINGGGTVYAGDSYKLSLVVGPRPTRMPRKVGGVFFKIGMFFNRLGNKVHW